MELFKRISDAVINTATSKAVETASNFTEQVIDQGAVKAASFIGASLPKVAPPSNNQQVISDYEKRQYAQSVLNQPMMQPPPPNNISQGFPQNHYDGYGYNEQPQQYYDNQNYHQPYPYQQPIYYPPQQPMMPQAGLSFSPNEDLKLTEEKVVLMANYETNYFFRAMKIGKDVIRFLGVKFFSRTYDKDCEIIREYEANSSKDFALKRAYKKAIYNTKKLEEIKELENVDDDEVFKQYVYEVILYSLQKKNEKGLLKMPSLLEIVGKEMFFFGARVFSPNENMDVYLDSMIQSDLGISIVNNLKNAT